MRRSKQVNVHFGRHIEGGTNGLRRNVPHKLGTEIPHDTDRSQASKASFHRPAEKRYGRKTGGCDGFGELDIASALPPRHGPEVRDVFVVLMTFLAVGAVLANELDSVEHFLCDHLEEPRQQTRWDSIVGHQ